jgi:hypothetical protein
MLDFYFTNQFKKDLKLMEKRRKNIGKLFEIMALLIWGHCRNTAMNINSTAILKVFGIAILRGIGFYSINLMKVSK